MDADSVFGRTNGVERTPGGGGKASRIKEMEVVENAEENFRKNL